MTIERLATIQIKWNGAACLVSENIQFCSLLLINTVQINLIRELYECAYQIWPKAEGFSFYLCYLPNISSENICVTVSLSLSVWHNVIEGRCVCLRACKFWTKNVYQCFSIWMRVCVLKYIRLCSLFFL